MLTLDYATEMSTMAVDILLSEGDPFGGRVDRDSLVKEIRQAILKKLVTEDSDFLSEEEFQACVRAATVS